MRNFRRIAALLCLAGPGVAAAEPSHGSEHVAEYVEDPYAPHETSGTTARLGTAVGFVYGERRNVTAVGLTAAAGHRWGRVAVEAEYSWLEFQELGPSSLSLGRGHRLGVLGRLDVLRLDSRVVGANSMLAVYIEGGAGVAWNGWYAPAYNDASRLVPEDSKNVEAIAGAGIAIDHRLQEPISFPRRIGWFLGWRMAFAPHATEAASICRGVECRPAPMMPEQRFTDRSMLFQSSLLFTW